LDQFGKAPLHERIRPLGWLRTPLRKAFFGFLRKVSRTPDARALAAETLRGLLNWRPEGALHDASSPYPELGRSRLREQPSQRADAVFITARFRSGSTLLWNLFRNVEGVTSYYEPLNERRWFDPAHRGSRMDPSHLRVSDYWTEYEGLEELGSSFKESWNDRHLYMEASFWEPDLKHYVETLIARARGRPVLQFNRIDLRLPWFRRNFPRAKIVHLVRQPRDQWCSSLGDASRFTRDMSMAQFAAHDHYYLRIWAKDLAYHFPFLDENTVSHPYQLSYYIWKLSFLFGRAYADYSICFENLLEEPGKRLEEMFGVLGLACHDQAKLLNLIVKPAIGKWKEYADDQWFADQESACETVLEEFLNRT
jgi:hypothetical protein